MKIHHTYLIFFIAALCGVMALFPAAVQKTDAQNAPPATPGGYLMKFQRMAGYFGIHEEFYIYEDGRIINTAGKVAKVPPADVRAWMNQFSLMNAPDEAETNVAPSVCMDCFTYRITIYGQDRIRTRAFTPGAPSEKALNFGMFNLIQMRSQLRNLSWN